MTPDWYEDLAERLSDAEHEASFASDKASATQFSAAIAAARRRATELLVEHGCVSTPTPRARCGAATGG